ncbi:MAG: hypothetical protein AAF658_16825, partial [Myxococcota bacterium]
MALRFWSAPRAYVSLAALGVIAGVGSADAQIPLSGYDSDDFIVAFSEAGSTFQPGNPNSIGSIVVFDSDRTFKGYLDPFFDTVSGMDFDAAGRVVATSAAANEVRVYTPDGDLVPELSFSSPALGAAIDLKVGPSGNYFVGTQSSRGARGIVEFTPSGDAVRSFDNPDAANSADYDGVAVLPGGVLWGGGFGLPPGDFIDVHDIESGGLSSRIAFDNGQSSAVSMFYDRNTDTVLTVDIDADMVFERDLDGNFLRSFEVPDGVVGNAGDPIIMNTSLGVTRGPNGEVYATNQGTLSNVPGATDGNGIFVWDA